MVSFNFNLAESKMLFQYQVTSMIVEFLFADLFLTNFYPDNCIICRLFITRADNDKAKERNDL